MLDKVKGTIGAEDNKNIGDNLKLVQKLTENLSKLVYLSEVSADPYKFPCSRRRFNCCGFKFISLFHENKQMGVYLRNAFKGTHIWIPASFANVSYAPVKIDAMFFPATEEKVKVGDTS